MGTGGSESGNLRLTAIVKKRMPGLTAAKAAALCEAATVCLDDQGHESGVRLDVHGSTATAYALVHHEPDDSQRRTYADDEEATEEGATAIAVAVVLDITEYLVVERAAKGGGFDYWLGSEIGDFQARLEMSGIRHGSVQEIRGRLRRKQRRRDR